MSKLIDITGKALSGEWGTDDELGTGIPVLRTTNFTNNGVVNYKDVVTRTITKKNIDDKFLRNGDIIIEKSGGSDKQPVGRVIYFEGPENTYLFNNFTGLLRVKKIDKWFPKYVFYALFSNYQKGGTRRFENKTTGLHNLKTDIYISSFEIKDIDILTQEKICKQLDSVRNIIQLRKQQLQQLDELVKARFVELFGSINDYKKLEYFSKLITKGASPKWQGIDYTDNGTLFVTSENVRDGFLDLSRKKYLDNKINEIQPRSVLKRNDVLINIVGASIGRAAIYDCDELANINQAVALVRVDFSLINQTYLMTYLNLPRAMEMYRQMKKGGARDNLSLKNISDLRIPNAPIDLQNEFANFVKEVDKSKFVEQKISDKILFLFNSLTKKYLTEVSDTDV